MKRSINGILVTGATGLSGSYVVRELQQRGLAVRALVREASVPAIQAMNADLVIGDLADPDSLRLLNSASVVHLGATSKGARNERKYT